MNIKIEFVAEELFSYAYHLGDKPLIQYIKIHNMGNETTESMRLQISSNLKIFEDYITEEIPPIASNEIYTVKNFEFQFNTGLLANFAEEVKDTLNIQVFIGEVCAADTSHEFKVMTYGEVSNWIKDMKMLASFVMPNNPEISELINLVSERKGEKYKEQEYSILGYFGDKDEVIRTLKCTYEVVQKLEIIYVILKQGFHLGWQRIRMVDEVLNEKQGNCLDLSLFFSSLLEAEGLNPIIISIKGHAFVGVWTKDKHFDDAAYTDGQKIYQMLIENKDDLILFECTLARKNANTNFESASQYVYEKHLKPELLETLVDVKAAREEGILPIPSRIHQGEGIEKSEGEFSYPTEENDEQIPVTDEETEEEIAEKDELEEGELEEAPQIQVPDKIVRWKNKLLDLTASSDLLNIKLTSDGKNAAAIPEIDIYELYSEIKEGSIFTVIENVNAEKTVVADLEQKILHTNYSEEVTKRLLQSFYNKDREYRNQKGASIMYLTLGSVHWNDKKNEKWYHAPVLMIPMEFKKDAGTFKIYYDNTEIRVNAAVLEMINGRFGVEVAGVIPEPMDEDGKPNLQLILKRLKKAFHEVTDLEVEELAHIGVFSFAQYMMWNDLDKNEEFYLNHPLIRSIKEGEKNEQIDVDIQEFDEDKVFLPIVADGAQLKALAAALGNNSFVLHGPPGTGKSQTITGMLANFIGYDRTVLFAAEKAAALQVVYNRMKAIGLDKFCLYLPVDASNRSMKDRVLTQYRELMECAELQPTNYEEVFNEIQTKKAELEEQLAVFDSVEYAGYTLKELIGNVLNHKEQLVSTTELDENIKELIRAGKLKELEQLLKDTMRLGTLLGNVKEHPLNQWGKIEYKFGIQRDLRTLLCKYEELLKEAAVYEEKLEALGWRQEERKYTTEWEKCQLLVDALQIPDTIRRMENLQEKLVEWIEWLDVGEKKKELCRDDVNLKITGLDLKRMVNKWNYIKDSYTYAAEYDKLVIKNKLTEYISEDRIRNLSDRYVTELLDRAVKLQELNEKYPEKLSFHLALNRREALSLKHFLDRSFENGIPKAIKKVSAEDKQSLEELVIVLKEKAALEKKMDVFLGKDVFPKDLGNTLAEKQKYIRKHIEAIDSLREWCDYQNMKEVCMENGLAPWISLYEDTGIAQEIVLSDFLSCHCVVMLQDIYENQKMVKEFAGFRFDYLVEQFAKLMDSFYAINAEEVKYRHLKKIQDVMNDAIYEKEKVALKKMIEANGKGVTIRELMELTGKFALKLTPCVMATPMTTSMYFAPQAVQFDHMILDEASQLQTCKAVGLLARSKHSIVVGDPNQMPPTSFFEGASADYHLGVLEEDQESILKDCIALDLTNHYLRWHYRSNHESLIAFSNQSYYGGRMITFPTANKKSKVRVVRTNGIYDRGNTITNPIEAETLVTHLEEMIVNGDQRSFGIVAFNKRQQTLIEQLIDEHAEKNELFSQGLKNMEESGEPVFVRNLESVQGDERDVILFSIGYGPDKEGKIIMAFGPLGKAGGWRRLNVAVTRSRDEMILFTSMDADQMNLSETSPRGVVDLKRFIAYAEGDTVFGVETEAIQKKSDGFMEAICSYLDEKGFVYETNIGNSSLKVDVAVYDTKQENFVLGIMLNNKKVNTDFSIYDSEISQNRILKKQGWNLLRIWSLDWFEDPEREKNRIFEKVKHFMKCEEER